MPIRRLDPKPGAPEIESGDFLAFLKERGITVNGDTVIPYKDGRVEVDTLATTSLDEAWAAYEPPAPLPPAETRREQLLAALEATTTFEEFKAVVIDVAGPALVLREV